MRYLCFNSSPPSRVAVKISRIRDTLNPSTCLDLTTNTKTDRSAQKQTKRRLKKKIIIMFSVMCQVSPVTCHPSLVTCHLSPVTCHLFTCHLSPVTCHLSPVTCHLSPVTGHLSPVTCHLRPQPQLQSIPTLRSRVVCKHPKTIANLQISKSPIGQTKKSGKAP